MRENGVEKRYRAFQKAKVVSSVQGGICWPA